MPGVANALARPHAASATDGLGVAPAAPVGIVGVDLVPRLAPLEPEQGVHPHLDSDALHVVGERLEAAVEQVLLLGPDSGVPAPGWLPV